MEQQILCLNSLLYGAPLQRNVSSLPDMDGQSIKSAMVKFDNFMVSPDNYHFNQMTLLKAPKHRCVINFSPPTPKLSAEASC